MTKFWYGDKPDSVGDNRWLELGKSSYVLLPSYPKLSRDVIALSQSEDEVQKRFADHFIEGFAYKELARTYNDDQYAGDDIDCDCRYFVTEEGSKARFVIGERIPMVTVRDIIRLNELDNIDTMRLIRQINIPQNESHKAVEGFTISVVCEGGHKTYNIRPSIVSVFLNSQYNSIFGLSSLAGCGKKFDRGLKILSDAGIGSDVVTTCLQIDDNFELLTSRVSNKTVKIFADLRGATGVSAHRALAWALLPLLAGDSYGRLTTSDILAIKERFTVKEVLNLFDKGVTSFPSIMAMIDNDLDNEIIDSLLAS